MTEGVRSALRDGRPVSRVVRDGHGRLVAGATIQPSQFPVGIPELGVRPQPPAVIISAICCTRLPWYSSVDAAGPTPGPTQELILTHVPEGTELRLGYLHAEDAWGRGLGVNCSAAAWPGAGLEGMSARSSVASRWRTRHRRGCSSATGSYASLVPVRVATSATDSTWPTERPPGSNGTRYHPLRG